VQLRRVASYGGREAEALPAANRGFARVLEGMGRGTRDPGAQFHRPNQELPVRKIAALSALAALLAGLPLVEALAHDRRHGRRAHLYGPSPYTNPYEYWLGYYRAQAEVSFARRAGRARYYAATGRAVPSRYFGPPTNYYAEYYALNPYAYFNCDLARRGEGICPEPDFFKP
jgi:hypothetical protein